MIKAFKDEKVLRNSCKKKSMQLLQKILRHHVGIPAEASQTYTVYASQNLQSSLGQIRQLLMHKRQRKRTEYYLKPPRCFMTIKMVPKDGVATAQIVYHFVCKCLSCGIAWALVPRSWRLESTGWPAGGQCPGPNLFRSILFRARWGCWPYISFLHGG